MSRRHALAAVALAFAHSACFSEPAPVDVAGTESTASTSTSDGDGDGDSDSGESTSVESSADTGSTSTLGTTTGGDCVAFSEFSPGELADVDVAILVDTRPSMQDKGPALQSLMQSISDGAVDAGAHVALIADAKNGPCMPTPLGTDNCRSNSNPGAGFVRISAPTSLPDTDPLPLLLATLANTPPSVFRLSAQKHLVVVTDGDTNASLQSVNAQIAALGASYQFTRVHAVAGDMGPGNCAAPTNLIDIVDAWSGETPTLCPLESEALLVALRRRPSCVFDVPGLPNDVDEAYLEGVALVAGAAEVELPSASSVDTCAELPDAVVVQDFRALLCPGACTAYQDATEQPGELRFDFNTCPPR